MADKLLPCPFCGGEAEYIRSGEKLHYVTCNKCHSFVGHYKTKREVAEAWNNRTSPWRTGTPTEGGLYFVYDKYCGYGKRELKKDISEEQLKDAFHNVLAWIPIEPYKED